MDGLEEEYLEIEKELDHIISNAEESRVSGQIPRIWKGLVKRIRKNSLQERLPSEEYDERLFFAREFLGSLQTVLSPHHEGNDMPEADENHIWFHQGEPNRIREAVEKERYSLLSDNLENEAARYLARPWMQHNEIDWILLDSLIYSELCLFLHHIRLREYARKEMSRFFIFRPFRKKEIRENNVLFLKMFNAYQYATSPTIHPTMLREQLLLVTEQGAAFPTAVFSILDRTISRDPFVFVTLEE